MDFRAELDLLYRAERDRLFTYALNLTGRTAAAEDAVHDVFVRLCRSPVNALDLRAYVYRCVRNRCLDMMRRCEAADSADLESIYLLEGRSPDSELMSAERVHRVAAALDSLRNEEREVIVLHIYAALGFAEISEVLGEPMGTVASRYRRGLGKLCELLDGEIEP